MPPKNNGSQEQRLSDEAEFFQSPWSDDTQNIRNQILLVSLVGILMGAAGIFPKEINALGLTVDDINQRALLITWAAVDGYLTITLILHAYSDFMHTYWRVLTKFEARPLPEGESARQLFLEIQKTKARLKNLHLIRLLIDLLVPILSGIIAFTSLIWRCFRL